MVVYMNDMIPEDTGEFVAETYDEIRSRLPVYYYIQFNLQY